MRMQSGSVRKIARVHALIAALAASTGSAAMAGETILWTGGNGNGDVSQPTGVVMDQSGNFYGTGQVGGAYNAGGIFELVPGRNGEFTENVIYSFCPNGSPCTDGQSPLDRLVIDSSGILYGITYEGGAYNSGSVFALVPNAKHTIWTLNTLHSFCRVLSKSGTCADGERPVYGLTYQGAESGEIYDGTSTLYGTTSAGGRGGGLGFGLVYTLTHVKGKTERLEQVLHRFCSKRQCVDGATPQGVILDSNGTVWGTTSGGGTHGGSGVFYKLAFNGTKNRWKETLLYDFGSVAGDICCQTGPLVADTSGNFYGTGSNGGAHGVGGVFELSPAGSETILYSFCSQPNCVDGGNSNAGLTMDSKGNLYGETPTGGPSNGGEIFKISSGTFKVLFGFGGYSGDLFAPAGGVILDSSGNVYGSAIGGGTYNKGGVYKYSSRP